MLQSIYASKLYKASKRKSKIKAAAENPLNGELVTQLANSLDEEYQTDKYLATEQDKAQSSGDQASGSPDGGGDSSPEGGFGGGPSGGGHHSAGGGGPIGDLGSAPGEIVEDDMSSGDEGSLDGGEDGEGPAPEPDDSSDKPADVSESTIVRGKKVTASVDPCNFKDMGQVADQIKGLLNFKDSTSGVSRTFVKENELWIYYSDDINLNNIMAIVIDTLNGSGYTYLEFNRLARSDNAIVFEIAFKSSDNQVKPKQEEEVEPPETEEESLIKEQQ